MSPEEAAHRVFATSTNTSEIVSVNPLRDLIIDKEFDPVEYPKNERAVFILNSPRSGSTLLRVMLAGHPALFVPPELRMLLFNGNNCGDTPSRGLPFPASTFNSLLERFEDDPYAGDGFSIQRGYRRLQHLSGRLLVDKTPHYTLDVTVLNRAEEMFDDPLYVWLHRHPAAVAASFKGLGESFFWGNRISHLALSKDRVGELTWRMCNENIEGFLSGILAGRKHVLTYEQLITDAGPTMDKLCDFLGVGRHDKVLSPFDGDVARMLGFPDGDDPKFHERSKIDGTLVDSWKGVVDPTTFDEETKAIARRLGYEI